MITAILGPVMSKAKKESEFILKMGADMDIANQTLAIQKKEMADVKRGYKQFDDINRSHNRLE
jgi:hypothetical protein